MEVLVLEYMLTFIPYVVIGLFCLSLMFITALFLGIALEALEDAIAYVEERCDQRKNFKWIREKAVGQLSHPPKLAEAGALSVASHNDSCGALSEVS